MCKAVPTSNGMRRGSRPSSSSRGNRTAMSSFARGTRTYSMVKIATRSQTRRVRLDGRRRRQSLERRRDGVAKKGGTNSDCRRTGSGRNQVLLSTPCVPLLARSRQPSTEMLTQRGSDRRRQRISAFTRRMPVWAFTQSRPGRRNSTKRFQLEDKESLADLALPLRSGRENHHTGKTLCERKGAERDTHKTV